MLHNVNHRSQTATGNLLERVYMRDETPLYRFREGALDAIMRTRNLTSETQLAAILGTTPEGVARLRAGAKVSLRSAVQVCAMQGDSAYLGAYFDRVVVPDSIEGQKHAA